LTASTYVLHKCKDLGIAQPDVEALVAGYVRDIRSDKLSYMRRSVVEDALDAKKSMERFLLPGLYEYIISNSRHKDTVDEPSFRTMMKFSDLRTPSDWYPEARAMKRKVIMHVGPTNSGKTYSALKRLEDAKTGVYAGPLRLLAHEVYERLNNSGKACNLLTGEEQRVSDNVDKWACTVEMTPLNREFQVAVVDEIQMIGDDQRGWAWTQAFLGLRSKEIHLCGEATTVPLIKRICELTGDDITVNEYNRLTPLHLEKRGFSGSLSNIMPGDCFVTFSRRNIFALRKRVESFGTYQAAIIYGGLPPGEFLVARAGVRCFFAVADAGAETRTEQAKLFNNPHSTYDVLVASDAIGMGLNLNIRRIIFESLSKFNGTETVPLTVSQIKQIAGRAGRFRTMYSEGYVCTFNNNDMPRLRQALGTDVVPPIPSAGLFPTLEQLVQFSSELPPETKFAELLDRFEELSRLDGDYFLCNLSSHKEIASSIEHIDLSLSDRYNLIGAPAATMSSNKQVATAFQKFASHIQRGEECLIEDIVELPSKEARTMETLQELENSHKIIMLYIWLSFRYRAIFTSTDSAAHLKRASEELINASLETMHDERVAEKRRKGLSFGKAGRLGKHELRRLHKKTMLEKTEEMRRQAERETDGGALSACAARTDATAGRADARWKEGVGAVVIAVGTDALDAANRDSAGTAGRTGRRHARVLRARVRRAYAARGRRQARRRQPPRYPPASITNLNLPVTWHLRGPLAHAPHPTRRPHRLVSDRIFSLNGRPQPPPPPGSAPVSTHARTRTASALREKLTKFTNCDVLRNGVVVRDETLWVRGTCIVDPATLFYDAERMPDEIVDLRSAAGTPATPSPTSASPRVGQRRRVLIVPGFLDLQINGFFGRDFADTTGIEESIEIVSSGLVKYGVTAFCPTLVSSSAETYQTVLPRLAQLRGKKRRRAEVLGLGVLVSAGGRLILCAGTHIEGPFIAVARKGAHDAAVLRAPADKNASDRLRDLTECYGPTVLASNAISIMTVAPELPGMRECVHAFKKACPRAVVSMGHTCAGVKEAETSLGAGVSMITHLFNAMNPFHHRDPGPIGVIGTARHSPAKKPFYGIIVDGVHADSASVRIAYMAHPTGCVLVTDAMAAAGVDFDGGDAVESLKLGEMVVERRSEVEVVLAGTDTLAGSVLTMPMAIKNLVRYTGCTLAEAINAATKHPAECLGIAARKGTLRAGGDADFVVLEVDDDQEDSRDCDSSLFEIRQ
ncbi:hypothetical protein HDU83_008488, partial [Entophlyctis luteolus]